MSLLGLALGGLAFAPGVRAAQDPGEPDIGVASGNVKEVAHRVEVTVVGRGWARATVTRTFEARQPSSPVALLRELALPADAVVTALAIDTDGTWRSGRLGRDRPGGPGRRRPRRSPGARPWAALEWLTGQQVELETPVFRAAGRFAVRYVLSARGEAVPGGVRWLFCPDEPDDVSPEVVLSPSAPAGTKTEVRSSVEQAGCRELVAREPASTKLTARYASYRLGPRSWLWRVELRVPPSVVPVPAPPEPGPVIFVLDASRSQARNGGLATQIAIVRAYLASAPRAEVELLLVVRSVARVFGRLVPVSEFERALPPDLPRRPLANGSFLDRGAAAAAEILAGAGRPGRIVLMTDGELRSAFDGAGVMRSLRGAPAGTAVHLVYPGAWGDAEVSPWDPEGLAAIPAAFGGGSYQVSIGKLPAQGQLRPLVRRLVWPDRLESIELHDAGRRDRPEWPRFPSSPLLGSDPEVAAGEERVWSALSPSPPPSRLALTGQVWSRRVELPLRPDATLARDLPLLATADVDTMGCAASLEDHTAVALAGGFLAPGLAFWIPGAGDTESFGTSGFDPDCAGGLSGSGRAAPPPARQDLPAALLDALVPCGLIVGPRRDAVARIETQGDEILDVTISGAGERERRCAEEALWNGRLPEPFNQGRRSREVYEIGLAAVASTGATPHR